MGNPGNGMSVMPGVREQMALPERADGEESKERRRKKGQNGSI